ncbi:hypothetical protein SAMN05192588_0219 [Nonlabens sp. Hel1_33_55]|uniref:hypothetical protein n=1 Tax=Nonlabens sp. Hel1_33_55 TaxID=1336802 RepID=UPI000875EFB4|nr:hypothetical protein [Nonlabens sp. Hel1_33_55]SCX90997.1 hypothetical protein SAMN05192588_0219 [Nonlabens sp. Hel1_33_55]
MKKLILPALLMLLAFTAQAQKNQDRDRGDRMEKRIARAEKMEPEAMASMQAKRMTLALDLTNKQEAQVEKVMLNNAIKRKEMMANRAANKENSKPSKEERMAMAEARMDQKIATKRAFKEILNDDQYTKFEKMAVMKEHRSRGRKDEARRSRK